MTAASRAKRGGTGGTPAGKPSSKAASAFGAMHPAAARWIGALIRMTAPHPALTAILDVVERLQEEPYRTSFVLLGEPGTGKEGLARALHHLSCPNGPLVRLDVAGFSDEDALAALMGAGKEEGAARRAHGGTLLIEEAAGLGPRTQAALLRLLKSGRIVSGSGAKGELDLRAIAMSDRDLPGEVAAGRFRHDLYWRLARVVLTLPPLRERPADLGPSAVWMGNRILRAAGKAAELVMTEDLARLDADERARAIELPATAIAALRAHDWPGNFRELEAVLERALLLHRTGRVLDAEAIERARRG
ncbi:MAG TPA: sigma 54-interacting transcriptional regulator [Polyangia bacterium]|nr:sigma 54-interacting transcriptional regulator [Polyangia bacterium]